MVKNICNDIHQWNDNNAVCSMTIHIVLYNKNLDMNFKAYLIYTDECAPNIYRHDSRSVDKLACQRC